MHAVLPNYAEQLAAFHRAFAAELKSVIQSLLIAPQMRVLDVGCGDGFYTALLAERLVSPGGVTGLDVNPAFLEAAERNPALSAARCDVQFVQGELSRLPFEAGFDFIWCAQSLYSLPEPVAALRQMGAALQPGGTVAVLENDSLHQLLLPWPSHLEIALRSAEYAAFAEESRRPGKFYVGRRLPAVFASAGLEPLGFRTQCIDRQAPLDEHLVTFLRSYLERLWQRVEKHLAAASVRELAALIEPAGEGYLLAQPQFTMSWINVLAWGRKPLDNKG